MTETILGLTVQKWVELIDTPSAENVGKALAYYDGKQECELKELLDEQRKNWRANGVIPRWRNITQMVIEKSGKLFKDKLPTITIYEDSANAPDETLTELFFNELSKTDWEEHFNNQDSITRLVKTAITLVQWDPIKSAFDFVLLHQANSAVVLNPSTQEPAGIIFKTSCADGIETYRIITDLEYIDLVETENELTKTSSVSIANRVPNPYGIIPIATFHDTRKPRNGFWNQPGMDLVNVNELYNLAMTDSEYTISWCKKPTLFMIDCNLGNSNQQSYETVTSYGDNLPHRQVKETVGQIGGPGRAIQLLSTPNGNPSIQFLAPVVDIKSLDEVTNKWIEQICHDWSVKINLGTDTRASSGFQVVVEEMPNRELRQQRAKFFEAGFKRLYQVMRTVYNTQLGRDIFPETSNIFIEFNEPNIPVDIKSNEEVWTLRIQSGRASVIDYLMQEYGMTKDEAELKQQEINKYNSTGIITQG